MSQIETVGDVPNRNKSAATQASMGWKKKANIKEVLLSEESKN